MWACGSSISSITVVNQQQRMIHGKKIMWAPTETMIALLLSCIAVFTLPSTEAAWFSKKTNNNNNNGVGASSCTNDNNNQCIGDGKRSIESSNTFFSSLDTDGDGAIEPNEISNFLRDKVGGAEFDTAIEVGTEVTKIMKRLDADNNDGLEMDDMIKHWTELEGLLNVEEVAEWIVYAGQMPVTVGR